VTCVVAGEAEQEDGESINENGEDDVEAKDDLECPGQHHVYGTRPDESAHHNPHLVHFMII
jgi:hypothetical protein